MEEQEFNNLITRYRQNQVTDQERELVEKWMELLSKDKDKVIADPQTGEEIKQALFARIAKDKARFFIPQWVRIAAGILIIISAALGAWQWQKVEILHSTTLSVQQKITLPDGSIIWLKPHSSLTYPERFTGATRNITFTGEALFEIAKDKDHPFIIESGKLSATVLGTSFNIRTSKTEIAITVLTGKVSLATAGHAPLIVTANEKAIYHELENRLAKVVVKEEEKILVTNGTEYKMKFHGSMLGAVIDRLEKKFDVEIIVTSNGLKQCLLTGDYTDMSLRRTLDTMAKVLAFTYEYNEDAKQVIITGRGCM